MMLPDQLRALLQLEWRIFGLKHSPIVQISILFNLFMVPRQRNWEKASKRGSFPATHMELAVLMSLVSMFGHINTLEHYQTSNGA